METMGSGVEQNLPQTVTRQSADYVILGHYTSLSGYFSSLK